MKLSEAIRLGAMSGPQARWKLYDPETGGTCAQGAAALAIGCLDTNTGWYILPFPAAIHAIWKPVYREFMEAPCPECGRHEDGYISNGLMAHLNNEHGWTREQIAARVQAIEDAQVSPDPSCGSSTETPEIGVPTSVGVVATQK